MNNNTEPNKVQASAEVAPQAAPAAKKVQAVKVAPKDIHPSAEVMLTRQGDEFAEVVSMGNIPQSEIKKLDNNRYVLRRTGEIREYVHNEVKQYRPVMVAMRTLRGIIRANFKGAANEKHMTLTYQENITDPAVLHKDFKNFMDRMGTHYPKHKFEYVAVAEPQERGAWHMHVLIKSDKPRLYFEYKRDVPRNIRRMWREVIKGGGGVRVEKVPPDDVGSYFVAYFTDLIPPEVLKGGTAAEMSKARQKGARLHFYPKGMKFYRCSRGIIRPEKEKARYGQVQKEYGKPVYQEAVDLIEMNEAQEDRLLRNIQRQTHRKKE